LAGYHYLFQLATLVAANDGNILRVKIVFLAAVLIANVAMDDLAGLVRFAYWVLMVVVVYAFLPYSAEEDVLLVVAAQSSLVLEQSVLIETLVITDSLEESQRIVVAQAAQLA
jgi:hypothetical protein